MNEPTEQEPNIDWHGLDADNAFVAAQGLDVVAASITAQNKYPTAARFVEILAVALYRVSVEKAEAEGKQPRPLNEALQAHEKAQKRHVN